MTRSEFIPEKRPKNAKLKPVETPIPEDLQKKWDACLACATSFNTMASGQFKREHFTNVTMSLRFLSELHKNAVEDALTHPEAHLIPELKEFQDAEKKAKDGKN